MTESKERDVLSSIALNVVVHVCDGGEQSSAQKQAESKAFNSVAAPAHASLSLRLWLHHIFCLLQYTDVCAVGGICKPWRRLARSPRVWEQLHQRDHVRFRLSSAEIHALHAHLAEGAPRNELLEDALFALSRHSWFAVSVSDRLPQLDRYRWAIQSQIRYLHGRRIPNYEYYAHEPTEWRLDSLSLAGSQSEVRALA